MNKPFLLELGLEELPARFVTPSITQLAEKVQAWLDDKGLSYGEIHSYATPRRLAVLVENLADRQPDIHDETRGPALKIAKDESGAWTKAALGFAKGQGVETSQLEIKAVNGTDYVFAKTHKKGEKTSVLLPELKELITGLTFPKSMRWNTYSLRYARPIQWLVALYGEDVIPFSINGIETGRNTTGHRFLGTNFPLENPIEYADALKRHYVIADADERKAAIVSQLKQMEEEHSWIVPIDEALLEEVTQLVEYPTALSGSFDDSFLALPKEVLITTMREHQRYFPVEAKDGRLLPYFITVRNGNEEFIENVAKGNEKVLRARLSDAAFFYHEDQKISLQAANAKLDNIVFHEAIGTMGEKVARIGELSTWLAGEANLGAQERQTVERAAAIAKFDLVTYMVGEFPELQGRMGQEYAEKAGETPQVAKAIYEQYLPRFAGDKVPETEAGAVLALADKLDTVVSCFSIGLIPTGSQDPYALRRQATGIIHILLQTEMPLTLKNMAVHALDSIAKKGFMTEKVETTKQELISFFANRLKHVMLEAGFRYDIVDAVLAAPLVDVYTMFAKARLLTERAEDREFKEVTESLSRVTNLAKKAPKGGLISEDLFENETESRLLAATLEVEFGLAEAWKIKDAFAAYQALAQCRDTINTFFDHTMVMADNEAIRNNRLALLDRLAKSIQSYADFQKIVFSA
ncbi:glycine--tRNA ligase subunit beta [Shouchella clausii]|uniref:glycine--tRNA ligase subunit beta n=1 Tax=Shouchella clausii TaxID=79880 RepID=UPI000BA74ECA|nr:glycine--tRNA ligase subunit beta [Shouchella clausii]PAD13121.1 glycine--tRNA ligase subunit beta [Shouchella clausii]